MTIQALSHIGICVADLNASTRFYCEGLGFRPLHPLEVKGPEAARLLGLEDVELKALYLERDGTRIELLHFAQPGVTEPDGAAPPSPRPMNRPGLTHLSFRSHDLEKDLAQLTALGGQPLPRNPDRQPGFQGPCRFSSGSGWHANRIGTNARKPQRASRYAGLDLEPERSFDPGS